jgi:hypothetical protein
MITTSKKKQLQAIVQGGRTQSKSNWGLFDKENHQHNVHHHFVKHKMVKMISMKFQILPNGVLKSDKSPLTSF